MIWKVNGLMAREKISNILHDNAGVLGGELVLGLVLILWTMTNMRIQFKGIVFGFMALTALQANPIAIRILLCIIIGTPALLSDINQFHINILNWSFNNNSKTWTDICSFIKEMNSSLLFWSVAFAFIFWLLLKFVIKYDFLLTCPTIDYYTELENTSISDVIINKLKLEKEQAIAKEIKNFIIGSYGLIVGAIISFGVFLVKQPLLNKDLSGKLVSAFFNDSISVFGLGLAIVGLLILLQFIAYHFEIVGKQRIEIIDQCIEYRVNDKNGNNNDTVFGCVINDLKNKKILQLVEEKLKKVEQDEKKKKKNSQKSKQNTKGKQDAAQKPKQTTGEQDTAQKSKQNTEKKQDDSRKSKQGTEEEQANNPKLNSSGEKVQDDNDQGSNQDEQKKTREK